MRLYTIDAEHKMIVRSVIYGRKKNKLNKKKKKKLMNWNYSKNLHSLPFEMQALRRMSAECDRQLETLVSTQLVETQQALQLTRAAVKDLQSVLDGFELIDKKCKECKNLIQDFEDILKISRASKNLAMTFNVMSLFREIPEHGKRTLEMFESDIDKNLKPAYDNVTVLVNLKKRALEQGEKFASSGQRNKQQHHSSGDFSILETVAVTIEKQIRSNISDALYLGVEMPNVL
ncbi:hypothetical protein RFI_31623, partial [Reticulomyxa filosa]